MLSIIREPRSPPFPDLIIGMNINHVKIIELIGYSDQVNLPATVISQIVHTIIANNNKIEKIIARIF